MYQATVIDVWAWSRRRGRCRYCRAVIDWWLMTANCWRAFVPDVAPVSEARDSENGLRIWRLPRSAQHWSVCRRRPAAMPTIPVLLER